jgi:hypothetical protein
MPIWTVWDTRNNNTTGPFEEDDARKLAKDLNEFVFDNTFGGVLPRPTEIRGPFYPRFEIFEGRFWIDP